MSTMSRAGVTGMYSYGGQAARENARMYMPQLHGSQATDAGKCVRLLVT